jgi:hypothetical protein
MVRSLVLLISALFSAQQTPPPALGTGAEGSAGISTAPIDPTAAQEPEVEWICPMPQDSDIRMKGPGKCPRCGMTLVPGLPEPQEFPVRITARPKVLKAGQEAQLAFNIQDPKTFKPVKDFEIVHEKLYHLFVVSQDLKFFKHTHPEMQPDGKFLLGVTFPKPGLYRILSDFYPKGATPQLIANTVMVPGAGFKLETAKLDPDLTTKQTEGFKDGHEVPGNIEVELTMDPPQPIVGEKTLLFFKLKPGNDMEMYLGAWAHMMAASADLVDMIHSHPFLVTDPIGSDYKQLQFNMIFPRAGVYRVWIQMQRLGVVNTVAFNIPVTELK